MTSRDSSPVENAPADQASRALFEQFSQRLIGLARCHLDARLKNKVDPEDVVQSAYKSFFLRYGDQALATQGSDALWSLLTLITLRKCADRARYYRADRRDMNQEVGAPTGSQPEFWREAVSREPTPEHAMVLAETVEKVLREVGADERQVVELSLQGYSTQEISEQLSRAERSVRRLRERVRKYLEKLQEADDQ
ncbi:MAG: sigma-70 family RNA polymerase sigma factor [Planctomycetales bacterium]|nr:sigma-70 family RNA polymerase sigma factor [Planctomycetales bacterium]